MSSNDDMTSVEELVKPCVQMPRMMWMDFLKASRLIGLSASAHIRLLIARSTREILREHADHAHHIRQRQREGERRS